MNRRFQFWRRTHTALNQRVVGKIFMFGILRLSVASCFSGDIVDVKTPILVSHFSQRIKEPLCVSYTLCKGGGDCSRSGMRFKNVPQTHNLNRGVSATAGVIPE